MRYFIRLSYNGADFHGWQIQQNAVTVQSELNKALAVLLRKEVETTGCGRTDTGVHAKDFFVHFDFEEKISIPELLYKLNAILPFSIAIHEIFEVAADMHARFSALSRTYQYFIHQKKDPFSNGTSFFYSHPLDRERMNACCEIMKTYTDFSCFSKSGNQSFTNDCIITYAHWERKDASLIFTITANRFLRNMVRAIVGTMLEIGEHKIDEKQFIAILESKNRSDAGASVPAHGLFLTEIKYPFNQ